jgi:hypothetical protein
MVALEARVIERNGEIGDQALPDHATGVWANWKSIAHNSSGRSGPSHVADHEHPRAVPALACLRGL